MLNKSIATTLTLAAALALAGCGGGKPQDSTTAAAPATPAATTPTMPANHPAAQPGSGVDVGQIAKADGGKTVAEVFEQKDALAKTKVTVRGKVVKLNRGIMSKDWLHVRDGSGAQGTNDLTVTTSGTNPLPVVGDIVVVTGTVAVNQDYGAGYSYPVILEDAVVTIEPSTTP